jgi:hypothetical protein
MRRRSERPRSEASRSSKRSNVPSIHHSHPASSFHLPRSIDFLVVTFDARLLLPQIVS